MRIISPEVGVITSEEMVKRNVKYFFYVEGYSECNFVESFLRWRLNVSAAKDIMEVNVKDYYLKNCEGESSIYGVLRSNHWKIEEMADVTIVIVQDIGKSNCYNLFKKSAQGDLNEIGITKRLKVIALRPAMEQIYLEDKNLLKQVIKGYYNHNTIAEQVKEFGELKGADLLTDDCRRGDIINNILKKNGVGMSKNKFSKKFFENAFKKNAKLSIIERIEKIAPPVKRS